jgi:uncharacterized membrane protein YedE/YeeE
MRHLTAFLSGLLFGLGLLVAGMANPAKVLGFLDLAGTWDPSLAFVMAGGIAVALTGFLASRRRTQSLLGLPLGHPAATRIDAPLVWGSLVFGVGWGLAGICPGPGLVLLGAGRSEGLVFVAAMVAGMGLHALWQRRDSRTAAKLHTS